MRRLALSLCAAMLIATGSACTEGKKEVSTAAKTDVATLRKLVTLNPAPAAATWSITTIGSDDEFGPSDSELWAVLRYADADSETVARALEESEASTQATTKTPPAWLLADVDLGQYRRGGAYVFGPGVSSARPFASDLYANGFAMRLPDRRVLIHFSTQ